MPVPEYAQAAVDSLYSQGLQGEREDGEGVMSMALGQGVQAMLYMDDTTLVAKTKGGLRSLTVKYMKFCKKIRMRPNHKKSKVMHYMTLYRSVFGAVGEPDDAGFEAGGVRFEQPKAPKTDPMIGRRQYKPSRLQSLWEKLLGKATIVADDDKRGSFVSRRDAFTRKSGLMSETREIPWDIRVQGRAAGRWRRIRTHGGTLAGRAFTKPVAQGTARQAPALGHHMYMTALGMMQTRGVHGGVGGAHQGEDGEGTEVSAVHPRGRSEVGRAAS